MSNEIPPETFAEVVHRLRRRRGLTLVEVGRLTGRSRGAVRAWEEGAIPRGEAFASLAAALGVPEEALRATALGGAGSRVRPCPACGAERPHSDADRRAAHTDGHRRAEERGSARTGLDGSGARPLVELLILLRQAIFRAREAKWEPDPVTAAVRRVEAGFLEREFGREAAATAWIELMALLAEIGVLDADAAGGEGGPDR